MLDVTPNSFLIIDIDNLIRRSRFANLLRRYPEANDSSQLFTKFWKKECEFAMLVIQDVFKNL